MNALATWISFMTIVRKEVVRFMRIWMQTLLPSSITMTLYFVVFGTFIGSRIGDVGGVPYIQFIVPGLVMMAVITNTYSNVVSSFFGAKFQHSIEELLVSPTPNWVIILGHAVGGMARGLIVGVIVLIVSRIFAKIVIYDLPAVFVFILVTSIVFSLAGFTNGVFARKFDDVAIVPTFVLTPLIYLGGVFYSIDVLPQVWQTISRFNPILYMINGFRYGFLGISDTNVWFALSMLILVAVALFYLNLILLKKGIGLKH